MIDSTRVDARPRPWRLVAGWLGVAVYTLLAVFLAHQGITAAFDFGWYDESFWTNLGRMFFPYLVPASLVMLLGLVSLRWSRVGLGVHLALAGGLVVLGWWSEIPFPLELAALIVALGVLLYFAGAISPRRWAVAALVGLPIATLVGFGVGPAIRAATRISDEETGARRVIGNGVTLVWAPAGPGWPDSHYSSGWSESLGICRFLSEDGRALGLDLLDVWRLPTVEEVVRSMARHGENSGGMWDATSGKASYEVSPDKEPPLWHVRSPVGTWWTSTEVDDERAYAVTYDGQVESYDKNLSSGTVAFRCVRDPDRVSSAERPAGVQAPRPQSGNHRARLGHPDLQGVWDFRTAILDDNMEKDRLMANRS